MAYTVNVTEEFTAWWNNELTAEEREMFDTAVGLLKDKGPLLGRPYADTLEGSKYSNMKELRASHKKDVALRIFFAFDPTRAAILLIGGDKHADAGFYDKLIKQADGLYTNHLAALKSR